MPQYKDGPVGWGSLFGHNISPDRRTRTRPRLHRKLMPGILAGTIEPGKVFDTSTTLDGVSGRIPGHGRPHSLKVFIRP